MQVLDKKKLLLLIVFSFISFSFYSENVYADNLDRVRLEYNNKNYEEALRLLKVEIHKNPNNSESYKLLGLIYEELFEVEKSIEAYRIYEKLKRKEKIVTKISPLPKLSATPSPTPLNKLEKIKPSSIPSISKTPVPKISPIPKQTSIPVTPIPTLKPTPIPKLVKNIENKISIKVNNDGWENLKVNKIEKKKSIKLIPKDSIDLEEIEKFANDNKEFILVNCNIKYSKNIIIKNNTEQIFLKDFDDNKYNLFAINTFVFRYDGDNPSKKSETIQLSDYYQLSLKEIRNNITFIFEINENSKIKSLNIKDYKEIDISNYQFS